MTVEPSPLWFFMHVPKTGGSALRKLIEKRYPSEQRVLYSPMRELFASTEPLIRPRWDDLTDRLRNPENRFVYGHLFFGTHEATTRPARYITVLREPVARVVSNYYFRREHGHCGNPPLSLRDFVLGQASDPAMRCEADNLQTRFLSGSSGLPHPTHRGRCTEGMLANALHNLSGAFALVGLTERMDETVRQLEQAAGWKDSIAVDRERTTYPYPPVSSLPTDLRDEILEINRFDAALYRFAEQRFPGRTTPPGLSPVK